MISLVLPDYIKNEGEVDFFPDPRTIKVKSGNSLTDYLGIKLWFELGSSTKITQHNITSEKCLGLKFTDWIAHITWSHYEYGQKSYFKDLLSHTQTKKLYF